MWSPRCLLVAVFGIVSVASTAMADRPIVPAARWSLDEPSGQLARGGRRDAEVHGARFAEGVLGKALVFDGQDDYASLGDLGQFPAVTVAFWVRPDRLDHPGWQGLVTSDTWDEGILHVGLRFRRVEVNLHIGKQRRVQLVSSSLKQGQWYHVAVMVDVSGKQARLFVNGFEEDAKPLGGYQGPIRLARQVIGREFDGSRPARYFQGAIDQVEYYSAALSPEQVRRLCPNTKANVADWRNIRAGHRIPDEGYCDQPYTVVRGDGGWVCTLTTGPGVEGQRGQHIAATVSTDQGRSWSQLIDIEPSSGPEASWAMPLITPSGRIYVFYSYNGENVHTWQGKPIRADTIGWYCYKYSDDGGRTWSNRHRLPLPPAEVDRNNTFGGRHQIFWGIGKPVTDGHSVWFAFSRCRQLVVDKSEGWFYHSDNILREADPAQIHWELLPDGDRGLKNPKYGDVHAEQNLVVLNDGGLYCVYRTVAGHPLCAYSRDGGHTWTVPEPVTYRPLTSLVAGGENAAGKPADARGPQPPLSKGPPLKHPRACARVWKTSGGRYLLWFHNHGDTSGGGWKGRNPAWIVGGMEHDGQIFWSQPEILLYDPDPNVRISYPDLIEQDGKYWITETQKTVARVHPIDASLFEAVWNQHRRKEVAQDGLLLELPAGKPHRGAVALPGPLDVEQSGGLTLEVWLQYGQMDSGQVLLDNRDEQGRGFVLTATGSGTLHLELSDGIAHAAWDSDPVIRAETMHHVVAIVDPGPRIITFVVDGRLCDGGPWRPYGWGRYPVPVGNVGGSGRLKVAPQFHGQILAVRVYGRYLRTSEAVGNYRAGLQARAASDR